MINGALGGGALAVGLELIALLLNGLLNIPDSIRAGDGFYVFSVCHCFYSITELAQHT